jgi:hypothetical protein
MSAATPHNRAHRIIAEVHGFRRHQDAQRARRPDHSIAFSAPMIALTIAGSAPRQMKTLVPATSSSIECGRAVSGLRASPDELLGVAAGSTTTATKASGGKLS